MTGAMVILGAGGQVARAWAAIAENPVIFSQQDIDLSRPDFIQTLEQKLGSTAVSAVINAAAHTQVQLAEKEEELATRINAEAVGELAAWCKARGAALVHYSTDYVFGDDGTHAHREGDRTAPLNAYGRSKLAGEQAIQKIGGHYLIFRTSWVYDAQGKNFFNTMLRLFTENEIMTVVGDQVGAPTYAPHLAAASKAALKKAFAAETFPSGIYHLCNSGETSWQGFASAILSLARSYDSGIKCQQVNPISTAERADPVKRPRNSRLDGSKLRDTFGIAMPSWEEGLSACIKEKYGHSGLQHPRTKAHTS